MHRRGSGKSSRLVMAIREVEAPSQLQEADFALACRLIAQYAGIKLSPHKRYMVYNRIVRRLRARNMTDFGEYLQLVQLVVFGVRVVFVFVLLSFFFVFFCVL